MNISFVDILDYIGTFAFAVSGIRMAASKRIDWFGACLVGFVTAIGGGTIRDLLLDAVPFWMIHPSYIIITGFAFVFVLAFGKWVVRFDYTIFVFDAIGLGLFTVVGIDKAYTLGFPIWVSIAMGMITGAFGGLLRDVIINQIPLILRKDIYATACIVGGVFYFICLRVGLNLYVTQMATVAVVILIRVLSVRFGVKLPVVKPFEDKPTKKSR